MTAFIASLAVGVLRYWRQGAYRGPLLIEVATPMALGSVGGAVLGAALAAAVPVRGLKLLLAIVLAVSSAKLLRWRSGK